MKPGQYKLLKELPDYPAGTRVVLYPGHKSVRIKNGGVGLQFSRYLFENLDNKRWFKYEGKETD